ncbi:MAG: hypothetical protein ACJAVV_000729, partial [Alphaproteobacteria bacterium]
SSIFETPNSKLAGAYPLVTALLFSPEHNSTVPLTLPGLSSQLIEVTNVLTWPLIWKFQLLLASIFIPAFKQNDVKPNINMMMRSISNLF